MYIEIVLFYSEKSKQVGEFVRGTEKVYHSLFTHLVTLPLCRQVGQQAKLHFSERAENGGSMHVHFDNTRDSVV